jgi:hypothetical protein
VWAAAAIAFALRWRRGFQHLTLIVLALAPFGIVAAQSYGGEALLRVYLYTLPACAMVLGADFAERHPKEPRTRLVKRLSVLTVVVVGLFPFARWGNERYEQVTRNEVQGVEWLYGNVPSGSRLVAVYWTVPWRYRGLISYEYVEDGSLRYFGPGYEERVVDAADTDSWIVLTRAQENFGITEDGLPPGWSSRVVELLESSGRFKVAFRNEDAVIVCGTTGSCLDTDARTG